MFDLPFIIGVLGSLVLVTGAAWPELKSITHPAKSIKNWLLAMGALLMLSYTVLGYLGGGPVFFIFLQILAVFASTLMMPAYWSRLDELT